MTAERGDRSYIPNQSFEAYRKQVETIDFPYPRLGILGGMGPDATGDLFNTINRITRDETSVSSDQDYLSIRVANNPQTPDRTKYINGESDEDPFPYLMMGIDELVSGPRPARIIGIPCNTAHYFVPALERYIDERGYNLEIVHMIEETAKQIKQAFPDAGSVGLLATSGTLRTGLYHMILEENGLSVIAPNDEDQDTLVMEGIYGKRTGKGVKAGHLDEPRGLFIEAATKLQEAGASVVIEGCTEIPLALSQNDTQIPLVNPTEVLARSMVMRALAKSR